MNNITDLGHIVQTILPSMWENMHHIGEYKWSARSEDFGHWYLCDGRSIEVAEHPTLYEIIGTRFGGSGCGTTFNLPDLRGRVMGCPGSGPGLTSRTLGDSLGEETHVLITTEMPSHTHTGTTASNGAHSHTINDPGHVHSQTTINDDFNGSGSSPPGFTQDSAGSMTWNNINSATTGITINSNGAHTHTLTTDSTGGGAAHNNMQPTIFAGNVFIFVGCRNHTLMEA